jgi:ATP-binding cassette subfamily B protein
MQRFARPPRTSSTDASITKRTAAPGTLSRALRYARPHTGLLLLFLVVVVFNAGIGIANPLIYREIINVGILTGNAPLIVYLALAIAGLGVFDAILGLLQTYLATRIGAAVVMSLRTQLFQHIQQMPLAFFARTQTGALAARLSGDAQGARSAFTDVLSNVAGNAITVVLIFIAMMALSWHIGLAVLILLPLFVLPARYWGRRMQAVTREAYDASAALSSVMVERFNVAGALLSKLFGNGAADVKTFEGKSEQLSRTGIKAGLYSRLFATMLVLMATFASALAYGWGGVLAARHELDVGTVVALAALLARLYFPLLGLSNAQVNVMTSLVSFERIFEVLDLKPMIAEKSAAMPLPNGPVSVAFEHVCFRYPGAAEVSLASLESIAIPEKRMPRTVLEDIDFRIQPGQLVALVGPTGSGKTTLTLLIPRLYDVHAGAVRINGMDVRDATLASLKERIGIVTQDTHLFHDSIRANLTYARPDATDEQMRAALHDAQILDLVDSLPEGLDTMTGERGYRFSGGERQRLAIARLLLKAPDLVILDEATAHLDSSSEAAVQTALDRALTGRTAMVIAHRLSTVRKAHQILVIQDGRIVQRGTHEELFAAPGLYAELYRRQFAPQESIDPSQAPKTAEELLDISQDRLLIPHEGPMVGAVEFDKARLREVAREMAPGSNANGAVPAAMEHQARHGDPAQEMPHIGVAQRLEHSLESSRARRGPQQSGPPGSRLRIGGEAGSERLDASGSTPYRDELA